MTITADTMKQEFARMGFTACPLSDLELSGMILAGFDTTEIYSVGCDVAAGFPLSEALPAVLSEDERFFWDHCGYGYRPETETKDTGRARAARQLAIAKRLRDRRREETAREAREAAYRESARAAYADDELQIDGNAAVSEADGGAWVAAWVWVPDEEGADE